MFPTDKWINLPRPKVIHALQFCFLFVCLFFDVLALTSPMHSTVIFPPRKSACLMGMSSPILVRNRPLLAPLRGGYSSRWEGST